MKSKGWMRLMMLRVRLSRMVAARVSSIIRKIAMEVQVGNLAANA